MPLGTSKEVGANLMDLVSVFVQGSVWDFHEVADRLEKVLDDMKNVGLIEDWRFDASSQEMREARELEDAMQGEDE